jgi:hypothetical protein
MPNDYLKIKRTFQKAHPRMPKKDVKKHAAKIAQSARKQRGEPPIFWRNG